MKIGRSSTACQRFSRNMLPVFCLAALCGSVSGSVVVPLPLESLAGQSAVIVIGQVRAIESYHDTLQDEIHTCILLQLEEALKGQAPGSQMAIRQPGGAAAGMESWILGSPEFRVGERVLLFLRPAADGVLRVAHLFQGKFTVAVDPATGLEYAWREIPREQVTLYGASESLAENFLLEDLRWMIRRVAVSAGSSEAALAGSIRWLPEAPAGKELRREFALLGTPSRWFGDSAGPVVPMHLNSLGEPAASGSGFPQFRAGYQAWSGIPGTGFRYEDAGMTQASGFRFDGVNTVSFRDPLRQMDAPVGCRGTLAIGGFYRSLSQTTVVNGQTFFRILEGDVVINAGWQGCGFYESFARMAEVATHELGHVLGLGHSADRNATMFAFAQFDGRGASLRPDDVAGLAYLYPETLRRYPVYRFFNVRTGTHFYTISEQEKDAVRQNLPEYIYEGPAFYAYVTEAADTSPLYRFFNARTGTHFYTISADERDIVLRDFPHFFYEGPVFYAHTSPAAGTLPLYRFYNVLTDTHFYTLSEDEKEQILLNMPQFVFEGTVCHAFAGP